MSTSDPAKLVPPLPQTPIPAELSAAAAGMPDPAIIARMATEMFGALSANPLTAAASTTGQRAALPEISSLTLPSAEQILPEAELRAIAETVTGSAAPPANNPVATIPSIGIPGGASAGEFSAVPSFSFLQDARNLFATPPAIPVHAVPIPVAPMSNVHQASSGQAGTDFGALSPMIANTKTPPIPSLPTDASMPQIPGAVARSSDFDRVTSPSTFATNSRPLEPIDVVPSLAPITSEIGKPGVSDLSSSQFDVNAIRRDFPILQERINGRQLIWLDNAATTQKPQAVIDRISSFYEHENSNIHRAAHTLARAATDAYEAAREKVRRFLNAPSTRDIIFVRGATEAINLVAQSWGRRHVQKDDEIVITWLEHHANIVPWQMLCAEKGARLRVAPVDNTGQVLLDEYEKLLGPKTRSSHSRTSPTRSAR